MVLMVMLSPNRLAQHCVALAMTSGGNPTRAAEPRTSLQSRRPRFRRYFLSASSGGNLFFGGEEDLAGDFSLGAAKGLGVGAFGGDFGAVVASEVKIGIGFFCSLAIRTRYSWSVSPSRRGYCFGFRPRPGFLVRNNWKSVV